jgi:hypothetical protein
MLYTQADNEIGPVIRKLLRNPKFRNLVDDAERDQDDE